jgi:hypothetical protein
LAVFQVGDYEIKGSPTSKSEGLTTRWKSDIALPTLTRGRECMELTPEERERIYQEEKARREARLQLEEEADRKALGTKRIPRYGGMLYLSLIFCLPLGWIGLVYSGKIDKCLDRGDLKGAWHASKMAKTLGVLAYIVGICGGIALIAMK